VHVGRRLIVQRYGVLRAVKYGPDGGRVILLEKLAGVRRRARLLVKSQVFHLLLNITDVYFEGEFALLLPEFF
jgi:hypothetical protein